MKKSMLDYSKLILEKVSFCPQLFEKERSKFQRLLSKEDRNELGDWIDRSAFKFPSL